VSANDRDEPAVRVFFALVPPPSLQQTLADLARDVARRAHGRPVPAENIHLTLAFIGAWPISRLPLLLGRGTRRAGEATHVTLDTLGGFRRAGIAWIGASAPPAPLIELANALGAALSAAGVAVDERTFHPHLTLARKCHGPYAHDAVGPYSWDVDAIALMRSETHAEGARYTMLRRWPLRAGTVAGESRDCS
jgi:2'-5' RNA ligase